MRGRYNNNGNNGILSALPALQATNTPRRRVNRNTRNTRLRQGNVQAGNPNFRSSTMALAASPARPNNRPTRRNSPANFPGRGPGPNGLNRGANPARALANRGLMPRGPAGIVPSPELAELSPLRHYRRSGGTRKKKNK